MLIHDNPFEQVGYIENIQPILFQVKVTHPSLRKRSGPSVDASEIGLITDQGVYDIFDTYSGWGQLEDGSWILLSFTSKIKEQ